MPLDLRAALTGFLLRCPRCRQGRMFRTFWPIHPACPACGYVFGVQEGEFTGAMMLAQFVWGLVALYGYFGLVFTTDAGPAVQWAWILGAGLLFPVLSYRHIKGLWVGIVRAGERMFDPAG